MSGQSNLRLGESVFHCEGTSGAAKLQETLQLALQTYMNVVSARSLCSPDFAQHLAIIHHEPSVSSRLFDRLWPSA